MSDDYHDLIDQLAPLLNNLRSNEQAVLQYSLFSDALVWSDEEPAGVPADNEMLQYLLRYRTSLIEGNSNPAFRPYWDAAKRAFPNWPGFAEVRCKPSQSLQTELGEKRRQAEEGLDGMIE